MDFQRNIVLVDKVLFLGIKLLVILFLILLSAVAQWFYNHLWEFLVWRGHLVLGTGLLFYGVLGLSSYFLIS